jgi:succinylglutamic semialdehyde dehydrogenase
MSLHTKIDLMIATARAAFEQWANTTLEQRIAFLKRFQNIIENKSEAFALLIAQESGKLLWEAKNEVTGVINKVNISIEAYQVRCPETIKDSAGIRTATRHRPHGVMSVFGPFNFPAHLPNGHIVPALLAGNTVVFKPSELTPLVGEFMVECWKEAGIPDGVINLVQGGPDIGIYLSQHPGIDGLLFTGSWNTGKLLLEFYAKHPEKILALELGGNNPLVIHDICDPLAAAYVTLLSAYSTAGQRCTCARRVIVTPGNERYLETLIALTKDLRVGFYDEKPEPFMGPVINEKAADKLLAAQKNLISLGAKPLIEMKSIKAGTPLLSPGLLDVTGIANLPDEEYFGPLLQLIHVSDFEEAISVANHTQYGLVAGLLCDKKEFFDRFFSRVKAGVINWNSPTTGASSNVPFGGVKHSGNFRPSAFYAADYCSYPVASTESDGVRLPKSLAPGVKIN